MTRFENAHQGTVLSHAIVMLVPLFVLSIAHAQVVPVPATVEAERIEGAKPRNVVFILSDDHRYDAMSFMGHPLAKTPHMDAMAE